MAFPDQIEAIPIHQHVILEDRLGVVCCHACRKAAVCSLDIAVAAVNPDDKGIVDDPHAITSITLKDPVPAYKEQTSAFHSSE